MELTIFSHSPHPQIAILVGHLCSPLKTLVIFVLDKLSCPDPADQVC